MTPERTKGNVYNQVTGTTRPLYVRTSEYGKRGEIKGLWKQT